MVACRRRRSLRSGAAAVRTVAGRPASYRRHISMVMRDSVGLRGYLPAGIRAGRPATRGWL